AEPGHEVELLLCTDEVLLELVLRDSLEVAEGLVQVEAVAEPVRQSGDRLRGVGGDEEVLFEDLHPVESRPGGAVELLLERAGQAHGGDRSSHRDLSSWTTSIYARLSPFVSSAVIATSPTATQTPAVKAETDTQCSPPAPATAEASTGARPPET